MPVSKQEKLLFIHIPKTGGTSIECFFDMCYRDCFWFEHWGQDMKSFLKFYRSELSDEPKSYYEPQHYPPEILKKIIPDYDDYFKFTFVRHPYTRILSEYYWHHSKIILHQNEFDPYRFHDWVVSYLADINSSHKEDQSFYLNESYNFIGRFECLEDDLKELIKMIKKHFPNYVIENKQLQLTHYTGLSKEMLIPLLKDDTRKFLYSIFKNDFEKLGYPTYL